MPHKDPKTRAEYFAGGAVINDSLYSEIKAMGILKALGQTPGELGSLQIAGPKQLK